MTVWQMYWLVKLDDISTTFCGGLIMSEIAFAIMLLVFCVGASLGENVTKLGDAMKKIALPCVIVFGLLATFTPTTRQLAAIILVPKLVNSEVVQRDIPQVYDLAVEWMKAKLAVPEAKVEK